METYSGAPSTEGCPRLKPPLWELGLRNGFQSYPKRPDELDCIYHLRTELCRYGDRCRFNHPPRNSMAMGHLRSSGGEYPERVGQPVCQFYMKTGTCKYGATCKYHHPKHGVGSSSPVAMNTSGFPLRPGEKECSYYVKTGQCKFGISCKFDHPQLSGMPEASPTIFHTSQLHKVIQGNWSVAQPAMLAGSYATENYGPILFPPSVVHVPGWTPYPVGAPLSSGTSSPGNPPQFGVGRIYGITQLSPLATAYVTAGASSSTQREALFPDRPGQQECQDYLRTGLCRFGATCKYHHPSQQASPWTNVMFTPVELPLPPAAAVMYSYYLHNGAWKMYPDHMAALSCSMSCNATAAPSSDLKLELHSEGEEEESCAGEA